MSDDEWTAYSTRLVLSAHANGVAEGYRLAAMEAMKWGWRGGQQTYDQLAKTLLDLSMSAPIS